VVANEVRALAQRSADAAKDIKELIHTSCEQVSQGVALVGETGDKLGKIVSRVDEITVLINDIATAAERQAANLQQVNASVNEMDRVTQQNAAMVEETTAATRSLADEAGQLSGMVTSFRTRDVGGRPAIVRNPGEVRRHTATSAKPRANREAIASIGAGSGAERGAERGGAERGGARVAEAVGQDWSEF
jgi:methyl-accepting chemotaxis protein